MKSIDATPEGQRALLRLKLEQSAALASTQRVTRRLAHDVNNMLAIIKSSSEIALEDLDSSHSVTPDLTQIVKIVGQMTSMTSALRAFANPNKPAPEIVKLNDALASSALDLQGLVDDRAPLRLAPEPAVRPVSVAPQHLDLIIGSLCDNARDAFPDSATRAGDAGAPAKKNEITISTAAQSFDPALCETALASPDTVEYSVLSVSDNGCGAGEDARLHAFDPLFSTKSKRSGFGLSMVLSLAHLNKGFVRFSSEPDVGTTVDVFFPAVPKD